MNYVVTNTNDSGAGSLRQAMLDARDNPGPDTITCEVTGIIALLSPLPSVTDDLTILGPGAGSLTVSGGGTPGIFFIAASGALTIQGLSLADGNFTTGTANGGAINNLGTVSISDSVLTGNTAGRGGAIWNSGTATVADSVVILNSSVFRGGAVFNLGTLSVTHSVLSQNSGPNGGGAIWNSGTATVADSTLDLNTTVNTGGAIDSTGGLSVTTSTLSGNTARVGGGIFSTGPLAVIERSALVRNSVSVGGGALFIGGPATLINVTLSGNRAARGGGAILATGLIDASFATIADSVAVTDATGAVETAGSGLVRLLNSLIANTTDGSGNPRPNCVGTVTNAGGSFSTDITCVGFNVVTPAQLQLGPLQVNPPGTTPTHALLPGSVAIDAAISCNDLVGQPVLTDQRGVPRPQGPACDSGAYEAVPAPPRPPKKKERFVYPPPPDCGCSSLCPPSSPA